MSGRTVTSCSARRSASATLTRSHTHAVAGGTAGSGLGPEPGQPPFVEVGDVVTPGQTMCLLEAMKLFNELKADAAGRVTAIHAENGKPVEFGQLLFELEPIVAPPAL